MKVFLFVADALRMDHLSCYGYARKTTPRLDELLQDAVLFRNAFTQATWTRPAAASLFTGLYPSVHQVRTRTEKLAPSLLTLPEVLQVAGCRTAGFSAIGQLSRETGFDKGFEDFFELFDPGTISPSYPAGNSSGDMYASIDRINQIAFEWLDQSVDQDLFSLIWAIDPHDPYQPPAGHNLFGNRDPLAVKDADPTDRDHLIDLYDGEIHFLDAEFGRLIDHLKDLGIYKESLIIFTSDHGEAFFEHGFSAHGTIPFDELMRIPLIIKFPENQYGSTKVDGLTQIIDIFPTVLDYYQLDFQDDRIQGKSVLPVIENPKEPHHRYVFSEVQSQSFLKRHIGVRSGDWKYIKTINPDKDLKSVLEMIAYILKNNLLGSLIQNPAHYRRRYAGNLDEMLFDLTVDPGEEVNIVTQRGDKAEEYRAVLSSWIQTNEKFAGTWNLSPETFMESEELKAHLRNLGYL